MPGYLHYVIMRTRDSWYVSRPGAAKSYVKDIDKAQLFPTREAAEAERCAEGEHVITVSRITPNSRV